MKRFIPKLVIIYITTLICVFILEMFIGKYRHQLTFSEAQYYSFNCMASIEENFFTLQQNAICHMREPYGDFNTTGHINSLGYRGKEFSLKKPEGKKRILMIGDSMTFGWGVDDENTYPVNVEKTVGRSDVEVINAGFRDGRGPDSFYLFLKNHGLALSPDLIIYNLFVFNDVSDLAITNWDKIDIHGLPEQISSCCYDVTDGILHNKNLEFKYAYPILRESQLFLLLMNTIQERYTIGLLKNNQIVENLSRRTDIFFPDKYGAEWKKMFFLINALKDMADDNNIPFLLVLVPFNDQINLEKESYIKNQFMHGVDYLQKRIVEGIGPYGIEYYDLLPVFVSQKNKGVTSFPHDQHFNDLGTKIAGEAVGRYVLENYLK